MAMADPNFSEPRFIRPELISMIIKASKANIYVTYSEEQLSPQLSTHFWQRDETSAPARGDLGVQIRKWKEGLRDMLEEEAAKVGKPELARTLIPPVLEYLIEHLILLHEEAFEFRTLFAAGTGGVATPHSSASINDSIPDFKQDDASMSDLSSEQNGSIDKSNEENTPVVAEKVAESQDNSTQTEKAAKLHDYSTQTTPAKATARQALLPLDLKQKQEPMAQVENKGTQVDPLPQNHAGIQTVQEIPTPHVDPDLVEELNEKIQELLTMVEDLKEKLLAAENNTKVVEQELQAANEKISILAAENCDEKHAHQGKMEELAKKLSVAELKTEELGHQLVAANLKINMAENRTEEDDHLYKINELDKELQDCARQMVGQQKLLEQVAAADSKIVAIEANRCAANKQLAADETKTKPKEQQQVAEILKVFKLEAETGSREEDKSTTNYLSKELLDGEQAIEQRGILGRADDATNIKIYAFEAKDCAARKPLIGAETETKQLEQQQVAADLEVPITFEAETCGQKEDKSIVSEIRKKLLDGDHQKEQQPEKPLARAVTSKAEFSAKNPGRSTLDFQKRLKLKEPPKGIHDRIAMFEARSSVVENDAHQQAEPNLLKKLPEIEQNSRKEMEGQVAAAGAICKKRPSLLPGGGYVRCNKFIIQEQPKLLSSAKKKPDEEGQKVQQEQETEKQVEEVMKAEHLVEQDKKQMEQQVEQQKKQEEQLVEQGKQEEQQVEQGKQEEQQVEKGKQEKQQAEQGKKVEQKVVQEKAKGQHMRHKQAVEQEVQIHFEPGMEQQVKQGQEEDKKLKQRKEQNLEHKQVGQEPEVSHDKKATSDAESVVHPSIVDTALSVADSTKESTGLEDPLSKAAMSLCQSKDTILLRWCQDKIAPYLDLKIEDFSSSWQDGKAIYFLIKACLIDLNKDFLSCMEKSTPRANFETAKKAAVNAMGIDAKLNLDEMLNDNSPNLRGIQGFLEDVYNRMHAPPETERLKK